MKKILLLISLFLAGYLSSFSQGSCAGAAPFCTSTGVTFPASTSTTAPVGPNYGCLGSQPNPAWYYLNVATSGNIQIGIASTPLVDIDFCLWGPFATQAAMCAGTSGSPIDCSYSTAPTEQIDITGAVAGQWYMLLITNFSGVACNITGSAQNAPGVDGTTNCAILCNMTGLTAVPGACNPATNLYTLSGTITTTTPPSTGTLTITNSCGGSTVLSPPFATSIAYSFPGMTSNGAGCSITATYSADPTCTLTTPYTAPAPCTGSCTATATNTGPYCAGATIQLNSTGGGTYSWSGPGAYSSTLQNPTRPASTAAMSGTYTVTVTSGALTCTAVTTVTVNPLPTVTAEPNLTFCAGAAVPANTFVSVPAGATFAWTNSNTTIGLAASGVTSTPGFTAVNATGAPITSTVTITPTLAGCPGTPITYTITVNPLPVTTVNSPTICPGGTATLTAGGATTYSWSTGAVTNPINVTPATTTSYTVTGTSLTCTSTAVATVTVGSSIVPTINSPTICNGATATLTATGGTTYAWNTGAVTNPINVTPATTTTYTVTATTGGCTGTAVATVTVNPIPATTVNSPTICAGATATLTGAGATTYSWSTGAVTNPITVTPATTTSYTVTGTSLGCTSTAVSTVTVNPLPVTTVNSPTICPSGTAVLTGAGATTYSWSTGAVTNPINVTPASTATYTVTGTTLGCTSTAIATVTIGSGMVVNAGLDDSVCFGMSTVLGVTPTGAGYAYSWTPVASLTGATTATPTATPATTTTYTVLVTDAGGCTGTSSVTVFADPQITMSIAGIDVTCNGACNGQTIVIPAGGTPAYTYAWTSGCAAASCSSLCPGTYTVTVTDSWGCTASGSATVTQPTLLTASVTATTPTSCNGVCDATATAAGAGGTVGYTYSWNTVPVQATATATGLCAGTYTCTVTDANGCTATTTATVTEPTLVVIAPIAPAVVCSGGSTVITASASGGNGTPYAYTWSPAAGLSATNIANPTATPAATTVYTVNATDPNGCPAAPVNVTVTVNPPLTVLASGTASICPGASANISAIASLGNGGPYTYTWLPAGTPSGSTVSVSPTTTTTYTVTAADGCSPTATSTVTITVLPLPTVAFSAPNTSGCAPLCVNFTDNSTVTGGTITAWVFDYGDGSAPDTAHSHCYTISGQYSVGLTVTSNSGCISSFTNTNMISVFPDPVADFTAPLSTSIIDPTVAFTDNSTNANTWSWNFGDPLSLSDTSHVQNPTYIFPEAGTYCVDLNVTSVNGCVDNTQLCIVIDPEFTFFIPNAFSPNGDGINDVFFGSGIGIKKYELYVYDRWGNLIFFADELNKSWDGKANHGSEMAQQDVYVWKVKLTDVFDKKHNYVGTVTIVK